MRAKSNVIFNWIEFYIKSCDRWPAKLIFQQAASQSWQFIRTSWTKFGFPTCSFQTKRGEQLISIIFFSFQVRECTPWSQITPCSVFPIMATCMFRSGSRSCFPVICHGLYKLPWNINFLFEAVLLLTNNLNIVADSRNHE